METIFLGISILTIGSLLFSIIYTAGVVWRVEMKLDISYKFFLLAVIFLFFAESIDLYYGLENGAFWALAVKSLRMLFALNFLVGVLFMRNILRSMDGEKRPIE